MNSLCLFLFIFSLTIKNVFPSIPIVINTWKFQNATIKAWEAVYIRSETAIESLVEGCSVCEREQCDGTVGYGGSPDENGETTLDAMIMDGKTMNIGAIAALRNIKNVIRVAQHVLENTKHTMLVGDQATDFAIAMGFQEEPLATPASKNIWRNWKENKCQPNYWMNVQPDPTKQCGPYEPVSENDINKNWNNNYEQFKFGPENHDTIGIIVIDKEKNIAAGTSTNGARHKIPGRVGDSPIPGAGAYADNEYGAAAATGDGDIMMRFLPSFLAVQLLREGLLPHQAAHQSLKRIIQFYPEFVGAVIVARYDGVYAAACHGMVSFPYSVYTEEKGNVIELENCV